jgi:hypothetical protein
MYVHAIFLICFPKGDPFLYPKIVQKGGCKLELHGEKGFMPSSNVHGMKEASNYMLL